MKDSVTIFKNLGKLLYAYVHGTNHPCAVLKDDGDDEEDIRCPRECDVKHNLGLDTAIAWEAFFLIDKFTRQTNIHFTEEKRKSITQDVFNEFYVAVKTLTSVVTLHSESYPILSHLICQVYDEALDFDIDALTTPIPKEEVNNND